MCVVFMHVILNPSHLTQSEAWRVVGWLEGRQTQAEVATATGVAQSVIFQDLDQVIGD